MCEMHAFHFGSSQVTSFTRKRLGSSPGASLDKPEDSEYSLPLEESADTLTLAS